MDRALKTRYHVPSGIARHNNLRCHSLRHCSIQRPEMSTFPTFLGTTTWDVNLSGIAWNHSPRCYHPQHCSRATTWDVYLHSIAWHRNPRWCHQQYYSGATTWDVNFLWHCLAPQPKMSFFTTLLEVKDLRCPMFAISLGRISLRYCLYIVFIFWRFFWIRPKLVILSLFPIHDPQKCVKRGS